MLRLKFSRWYLLVAAFLVEFCLGSIYAWSVLNQPIDLAFYGDAQKGRAVNAFYISMGVLGTATAALGPLVERKGPRWSVSIGSTLFLVGHLVTALGVYFASIALVYIGYGVITGLGIGLCTISPVSALQKWFPDYRGTAAGFATAGAGAGSVMWSKVFLPTIDAVGLGWMFVLIGSIISATMFATLVVLRDPPRDYTVNGRDIHGNRIEEREALEDQGDDIYTMYHTPKSGDQSEAAEFGYTPIESMTLKEAILSTDYIFMYFTFFANQLFGIIVVSRLSNMCTDIFKKSASTASDMVSINSAFNCCGRLAFSVISDLLVLIFSVEKTYARKMVYFFTLGAQIILIGMLPTVIRQESFTSFVIEIFVLTSCFGGGLGTIPALIADMYGPYNVGPLHGIIITSVSFAAVVGGITFNKAYNGKIVDGMSVDEAYIDNFQVILVIVCIGFVMLFFVRTDVKDRFEPGYHYSLCGKRIISIAPREYKASGHTGTVQSDSTCEISENI
ncbi:putative major facilitator superfamily, MFS transporter superfamily [Plasmopara halstedii]